MYATSLEGAEFEIYAGKIFSHRIIRWTSRSNRDLCKGYPGKAGDRSKNGAVIKDLREYRVKETKAPAGFVLNPDSQEVAFIYKDRRTPEIEEKLEFSNERQKVELSVEKRDAETGKGFKRCNLWIIQ